LGFLFSIGITFVTVPFFVSFLGDENYGLFVLIQSVMIGFSLVGFGFGQATVKYIAESIGHEDFKEANQIINTTMCLSLFIGTIGAIVIYLSAGLMAQKIFKISIQSQMVAQRCFHWMAIGWFINQIVATLSNIPTAFQNFKIVAMGTTLSSGLIAGFGLSVLFAGGDLTNLVQANVVALGISAIAWWFSAKRVFPEIKVRVAIDRNWFKRTMSYGSWHAVGNLGRIMYHWLDRVIIGIYLPPAAVGYYNVPVTICSTAHAGLSQIGAVFFPLISHMQGKNDNEKIRTYFLNGSWVIGLVSAIGYVPLALFGKSFLALWISPEFSEKTSQLFLIVVLSHAILSTSVMRYYFLSGIGKADWVAMGSILSGVVGVTTILVLIPRYGLIGAGWSYFASAISGTAITICVKIKFFPEQQWIDILYALWAPVAAGICVIAIGLTFLPYLAAGSWLQLFLYIGIAMLSTIIVLLLLDVFVFRSKTGSRFLWQHIHDILKAF
jgi:O-antigen/teichoic acid export membrane protein